MLDLVLKNGRVVDVARLSLVEADLGISGTRIAELADGLEGTRTLDLAGKFVAPGLVEPHVHYESSKLPLSAFVRLVMAHGTTTVVNDPHELANVLGLRGVQATLSEATRQPISVYTTIPSCVPASPFETSGARLDVKEVEALLAEEGAIGLGEVMNFPGVITGDPEVMGKLAAARSLGKIIEGHCPLLGGAGLRKYIEAGISSDHEVTEGWELEEKLKLGMAVYIRFGSQARDLQKLVGHILAEDIQSDLLAFCTDDRHIGDLLMHGHLDYTLRTAVSLGLDPLVAVSMATRNPSRHFGLEDRGVIAPGYRADLVVFDDLARFTPELVIAGGAVVARNGEALVPEVSCDYSFGLRSLQCPAFTAEQFRIRGRGNRARVNVIGVQEGRVITESEVVEVAVRDGMLEADTTRDLLKIAVIERYTGKGGYALGFVRGFGLQEGALGSTIAHDSHNIIVVGADDAAMATAVNALRALGGGEVVVSGNEVSSLALEFAGVISLDRPEAVVRAMARLERAYHRLGGTLASPFMALSFLALPVIPVLKITDQGLVAIGEQGLVRQALIAEIW